MSTPYNNPTDNSSSYGYGNSGASSYGSPAGSYGSAAESGYGAYNAGDQAYGAGYSQPPAQPAASPYAPGGVQPYGGSQPYYGAVLPEHPQATIILVLGILGIVGLSICAPFAWFMGNKARDEIAANPGVYKPDGSVQIGRILGMVGTILLAIGVVVMIIYFIFIAVMLAGVSTYR